MAIKDIVLQVVTQLPGVETVIYDNVYNTNIVLDRKPCPAAIVYCINDFHYDISKGVIKESAEVSVFFADLLPKVNSFSEDYTPVVDRMLEIATEFISSLVAAVKANNMELDNSVIELRTTFGKFDKHVCGISISGLKITDRQGRCL